MVDTARETFAARFGEDQAEAIEVAAQRHLRESLCHDDDWPGSQPFRYWFLGAIGYECVTRYRDKHGITADVDELKDWALNEADLGAHDGDIPDYLALAAGAYDGWIKAPEAVTE